MAVDDFYHHSWRKECRWPYGAILCGDSVLLRARTGGAYAGAECFVIVDVMGMEQTYEMTHVGGGWHERWVTMPDMQGLVYYEFLLHTVDGVRYYGSDEGTGEGRISSSYRPRYQITVYDGGFQTPGWAKGAVCYQIFVDRFKRSGKRGGLARMGAHTSLGRTLVAHEDWSETPLFKPLQGASFYSPCDVYGGDLQGVRDALPYLAEMGVEVLYLNPIFEAASNHKYDTGDYMCVDPLFGDNEEFSALCMAAKTLGISIILDGVFSHTGADSRYFNREGRYDDVGAYQSCDSPYASWFWFDEFPEVYRSWWGFKTLPEVQKMAPSYQHFIAGAEDSVLKYWVRMGARGWRLDVADELPEEFIQLLRRELKAADPDALLLGEVWEDASDKVSLGVKRRYVNGHELDSVMNYPLRDALVKFLLERIDARMCALRMERLRERYPAQFFHCTMNLLSSHDVPRILSLLGGAPDKDSGMPREEQAYYHLSKAQLALGLQRMRLAIVLQMVLPGMPCIYYGDEAGLTGLMDPFNRRTYPWGRQDMALLSDYRAAANARKLNDALRTGRCMVYAAGEGVLCVVRFVKGSKDALEHGAHNGVAVALVNAGGRSVQTRFNLLELCDGPDAGMLQARDVDGLYRDEMNKLPNMRVQAGYVRATLPPLTGALYILTREGRVKRK